MWSNQNHLAAGLGPKRPTGRFYPPDIRSTISRRMREVEIALRRAQNDAAEAKKRHNGADETVKHKEVENDDSEDDDDQAVARMAARGETSGTMRVVRGDRWDEPKSELGTRKAPANTRRRIRLCATRPPSDQTGGVGSRDILTMSSAIRGTGKPGPSNTALTDADARKKAQKQHSRRTSSRGFKPWRRD